jgi:hypothetical protein
MLKQALISEPILAMTLDNAPYCIETDASDVAVGAVLSQKQNSTWHPVVYMSKSHSPKQRNYNIYNKEFLAIILALKEWCQHLLGAEEPFEIWSDHKNLMYWKEPQLLTP